MDRRREDEAWQAIVDNYGDRPEVTVEEQPPPPPVRPAEPPAAVTVELAEDDLDPPPRYAVEERFVPPPPPPLPRTTPQRLVAWIGVLGSPALLVVLLIAGLTLPTFVALALVAWFVGGFCYLVFAMPSGPRDPWDDGAKV